MICKRIMANGMKKIILVLMIFLFVSCFGNDEEGNSVLILSKRDRCENTVRETQNGFNPETCIVMLAVVTPEKPPTYGTDATLLWCLVYQFEMAKCKKKSDVLPP
jgi:hypothetical protein